MQTSYALLAMSFSLAAFPQVSHADPAFILEFTRSTDGNTVRVTEHFAGDQDGVTDVAVENEWGGIAAETGSIVDVSALGSDGKSLVTKPSESGIGWSITHAPGEAITLAYTLHQPPDRQPLGPGHNDYRTHVSPSLFQMIGNHGLLYPAHMEDGVTREHEVRWSGFDLPGFHTVSSFGSGSVQKATVDAGAFRQGLYIAGELALVERDLHGARIGVVISGTDWGFKPEQFADLAFTIIKTEREFFDDNSDPWYLVSVTPEGEASEHRFSLGGTALTNCFALYCNAGLTLAEGSPHVERIQGVLAHEYFHTWNGVKFHIDGPEGANYWFSEGFTNYFARRMLERAGLWGKDDVLRDLNEAVGGYDSLLKKNATNEEIRQGFWTDPDLSRLPYLRGDLIALALDQQIRAYTGGKRTLDDSFRSLIKAWPKGSGSPDREMVLRILAGDAGQEFIDGLRPVIESGIDPPVPGEIPEHGATLATSTMRTFDPGFDVEKSQEARKIVGVKPGSGAEKAGLKDGMPLRRATIGEGGAPGAAPRGEVEVEVDGDWMKIAFDAVSPLLHVRTFKKK